MNYCDEAVPFTRITEHKHFAPWEEHGATIITREYSRAAAPGDDPYYPVRLSRDEPLLAAYAERARREQGVTFLGRLGTCRYLDMDVCVGEALRCARLFLGRRARGLAMPAFVTDPFGRA